MIGVLATLKIRPETNTTFEEVANRMTVAVKENEPGNVYYNFYKEDETTYIVMERYNTQADLDAHGKTEHMKTIGNEMGKYMAGPPEIKILQGL